MNNSELTYFYTDNFLDYFSERFDMHKTAYCTENNDYKFFAPILHKDGKVESGFLSLLPLPYVAGNASKAAVKSEMQNYFQQLYKYGQKRIALREDPLLNYNNQIIKSILQEGFVPNLFYTTVVDLRNSRETLWQNVRKSYRSCINSLDKNGDYNIVAVTADANNEYLKDWYKLYLSLLKRGGNNLPENKLRKIGEGIEENLGAVYLLYRNDELISGVQMNFYNKYGYYTASGTNPDYEKQDTFSHFLLWRVFCDMKEKGFEFFETGTVFYKHVVNFYFPSEKELSISDFKLGMGGKLTPFIVYEKSFE